jgi:alanyl-tRNA synthetase
LKTGENATLRIDIARRRSLRAHHSATHLLHSALRFKLGEHVTQKGSLVAEERLRFDVSYPKPITYDELSEVEYAVNRQISANTKVTTRLLTPDEAIEMGALALFGEKYGDQVRVVHMGDDGNQIYSNELCGGTHVNRTGDIGFFKIISEGAVAAGIRRIEAVTGMVAEAHLQNIQMILNNAASLLKVANKEVPKRIEALLEERRNMEKELSTARRTLLTTRGHIDGGAADLKDVAGVKFVGRILEGVPPKDLKTLADDLKNQITSGVVALVTSNEGKASLVVGVTKDLLENFNAVDLVRVGSEAVGGKGGGGRQDMAQAGGPNGSKSKNALVAIERAMTEQT